VNIDQALKRKELLGAALGSFETWRVWLAVLKAAFGLQLADEELAVFHTVAGNRAPPTSRVRELWAIVGRRGGKSRVAATLAVYLALFTKHKLADGERGLVLVIAASMEQAKTVFSYALAFFRSSPMLGKEIAEATRFEIRLRNGVIISTHSCSYRTVRGRTLVGCVLDEVAFFRDESSAMPDLETYRALLPSLATTNGMLIGISTPYRRVGLLHQKHRDHFGCDSDDTLVVSGGTRMFNPSISDAVIAAQSAADPEAAGAEWDAEFRRDIGAYLDDATIEAAIDHARALELPPVRGLHYRAFVDASGGRSDHYCVAVGHRHAGRYIVDLVKGVPPPFDPDLVTRELAGAIKSYRCFEVRGDRYGAEWVQGAWQRAGLRYVPSELDKSQIYAEALVTFTMGLVSLPDHPRLIRELRLLERHTHRSGKDSIDHARGAHDDYANAVAGVLRDLSAYYGYDAELLGRAYALNDVPKPVLSPKWRHHHPQFTDEQYARITAPVPFGPFPR